MKPLSKEMESLCLVKSKMTMIKFIYLILSMSIFVSCIEREAQNEKEEYILVESKKEIFSNDTICYDKFENFIQVNDTTYKASNFEFLNRNGLIYLHTKSNDNYKIIDFEGVDYDGPGYSFFLFNSLKTQLNKLIVIEAQSDIGTAWYYFIFVENDNITDTFIIKEPRSNSELYSIDKFIKVYKTNNKYVLMFKSELVAKYSKVSSSLSQRDGYYVLEKSIRKKKEIQNTTADTNNRKLIHIFYSNGGILTFYNDGTVTGCPQCDLNENNIELLKSKESFATYTADDKSIWIKYKNGDKSEMKFYVEGKISDDCAMKDGKWLK